MPPISRATASRLAAQVEHRPLVSCRLQRRAVARRPAPAAARHHWPPDPSRPCASPPVERSTECGAGRAQSSATLIALRSLPDVKARAASRMAPIRPSAAGWARTARLLDDRRISRTPAVADRPRREPAQTAARGPFEGSGEPQPRPHLADRRRHADRLVCRRDDPPDAGECAVESAGAPIWARSSHDDRIGDSCAG